MNELVEALLASKASISNTTRLLIQLGLIERVSLPGCRRDYFRIKPNAWSQLVKDEMLKLAAIRKLADRGLRLLEDREPQFRRRLQEMRDLYAFFERELPPVIERWEQTQPAGR
jgi:DNA-binding transcriptional regulator GbsR (MarR family)